MYKLEKLEKEIFDKVMDKKLWHKVTGSVAGWQCICGAPGKVQAIGSVVIGLSCTEKKCGRRWSFEL